MATTFRTKFLTATVAAAVAFNGFAPAANAGILDIFSNGLSISAGGQAEYDTTAPASTRKSSTTTRKSSDSIETTPTSDAETTPMAANYLADHRSETKVDMLGEDFDQVEKVWSNKLYRAKAVELATLINRHRAHHGKSTLRLDPTISVAAQAWAEHTTKYHWFDHDPASKKHAEILALRYTDLKNPDDAEHFIGKWEASPEHNAILYQDNFNVMGVGISVDEKTGQAVAVARFYYN